MRTSSGIHWLFAATNLMLLGGIVQSAPGADDNGSVQRTILREKPQEMESGRFLLEISPCYSTYKTNSADWFNAGLLLKANLGRGWDISLGSDFISYQNPDLGVSDVFVGTKWSFYKQDNLSMALTAYVLFPTGTKAFREPGIEPTLAFLVSKTLGDFEIGLSIGSTCAADACGEPLYPDLELSLELDYTLDDRNSFSVFACGYGPDARVGGAPRINAGTSYTRVLTRRQSMGIMLMKGFADRGLDWSGTLTYSLTF